MTTDFGIQDGYAGVVKGVILSACPSANIIDLTHEIDPWNIDSANWIVGVSAPFFPADSIHLAVVDPEVGTDRRAILLQADGKYFVGPDNGIFSNILETSKSIRAINLVERKYWLAKTSYTFHARDIFAPVVAHLASGIPAKEFGPELDPQSLLRLPLLTTIKSREGVRGRVVHVDRFGNLITNIPGSQVCFGSSCLLADREIGPIMDTYSSGNDGEPVAIVGSHGHVEIGIYQGNAAPVLKAGIKTEVTLRFHPSDQLD